RGLTLAPRDAAASRERREGWRVTVSRPVGRLLSAGPLPGSRWVTIHLCGLPVGCSGERAGRSHPRLGLAPGGVCRAARVAPGAGALLPHRFTLTCARRTGPSAVCSLWHFPAGRPDWPLASTLPCGVPTFLDAAGCCAAVTRPTHRLLQCARGRSGRPPAAHPEAHSTMIVPSMPGWFLHQ